jgi:hypothetical protein
MDQYEWIVFSCRACKGVVKLSPGLAGKQVICPRCRTKVSVPKDAVIVKEDAPHNPIPASRSSDNLMSRVRGPGREEWEVGNRPIGGDLEFRERLQDTSSPEMQPGAPGQPKVRKVNMKRRKLERTHPDFDDPDHAVRRRTSRRKLRSHGQRFGRKFVRVLVAAVIVLAAIAGWLAWKQYHQPTPEPSYKPEFVQKNTPLENAPDGKRKLETRSMAEYGPALREAVTRFVSARGVEDLLPLVRDRERVEKKIRAYYTPDNPWKPIEINNRFEPSDQFTVDGDFIVLQLVLANFDEIPISLERRGDEFLVDWESFTGYGEMSWHELTTKRPQHPVLMRVVIEKSLTTDYFNDTFSNPDTHHCYLLRDLRSEHLLSGYAAIDSTADSKIRQYLQPLAQPAAKFRTLAVVHLRYPPNAKNSRQVEITDFLENGWVFRRDE